jgi:serine/threonine protein kinase/tetratricopeptide (TPR) repeat protein
MTHEPWAERDGQWDRISTLFEMVVSLPSHERASFIELTCGSDTALRSELESLVASFDGAPAYLDQFHASVVQPALIESEPRVVPESGEISAAVSSQLKPGDQIRHFTVHERLGSGGAGVVYRGRDTLLQRDVAIKVLAPSLSGDPAARARLVREAQAASRLDDPHVCPIYAIETSADGELCIVMAYCAGGTLRDRVRRGEIPMADVESIATHLARGLASAHSAGIVHGDIKPANVGFGDGGVARLLDFGVAAHAHDAVGGSRGLSGTLPYLAPELWRGEPRGTRADVWALGVTFFEMITGRRPFTGADPVTLAEAIRRGVLPAVRRPNGAAVTEPVEQLIRQMLSVAPDERLADGSAVLAALTHAIAPSVTADALVTSPESATAASVDRKAFASRTSSATSSASHDASRGNRTAWIAVGAVAALGLAAWAIASTRSTAPSPAPPIEVARSSTPLSTIAVLPFTTRGGSNIDYLGDGMVDLLTPAFDATGLVRGIDPNTVLGAAGDRRDVTIDSAAAHSIAARTRADRYVVGSVVATGATLAFRATLRRIDGQEVGRAQVQVPDSSALTAGIDALVRQLIATELLAPGDTVAGIAASTTRSTRALRAYLNGERELRDARPAAAIVQFQDAIAADSTFALAWYRLARAARWNDVDSLSASAARRAWALASTLPPRQAALIRAYHTMRFGSPLDAERQLTQIVTDYPTDVEAWMLLGEVQFGSNPYYGRPIADAAAAFQQVMTLDPRNREVTVYLMDLADNAHRLGQLDTLYSMYFSPNSAGEQPGIRATYTALHRRRLGGTRAGRATTAVIDAPALARVALHRISSDIGDRAAARTYASVLAAAPSTRVEGLLALGTLDVAEGAWDAAALHFEGAAAVDADRALEYRALAALAPTVSVSADTLAALQRALATRRSVDARPGEALTITERDDIRRYLQGVLSVRLGDASGVEAARTALADRGAAQSRVAEALSHAVAGHWLLRRGEIARALAEFESSVPHIPARVRMEHAVLEQHLDRFARATVLRRLGRAEEASRWTRALADGFGVAGTPYVRVGESPAR